MRVAFTYRKRSTLAGRMATDCELLCLFVLQHVACGARAGWVNGVFILIDVPDDAFSIDHKRSAVGGRELGVQYPVVRRDLAREIAQQRKFDSDLFGKGFVGGGTIHANAQNLRAVFLEFGDISLIRLELLGSTTGESQNIERQHDILFSQKIA